MDAGQARNRESAAADWLGAGGEMARLIRSKDWSQTAVGSPEDWPQSLEGMKRLPPSRPVHGETMPVAFSPHTDLTMPGGNRAAEEDWPANPSSTPSEKLQ